LDRWLANAKRTASRHNETFQIHSKPQAGGDAVEREVSLVFRV
jgi:hypothetical protein